MIRLVLDSTCDLPQEFAEKHGIEIVPLSVAFGNQVYQQDIDLSTEQFYEKMALSVELPKTSQPSPRAFYEVFKKLSQDSHQILCLTVSSSLSGTYQSAVLASKMCEDAQIEIIDSKNVTLGIQILALEVLMMNETGMNFEEIVEKTKENVSKVRLIAAIDTLDYLIKGGRLSKAAGLIGTLASIKPVITISSDGTIETLGKFRGIKRALSSIAASVREMDVDASKAMTCGYTASPEHLNRFLDQLDDSRIHFEMTSHIGAVISAHAGPNAMAVAYFVK